MSKLQIIITVIVILVAFLAILVFSGVLPGIRPFGSQRTSDIEMWGTIPEEIFSEAILELHRDFRNISLIYVEKSQADFESELINALAAGQGPDLIIFPDEFILKHRDKILPLTVEVLTERNFRDTFIDGTELLILKEGILGLPLVLDPLVLYWNRDLFRNAALSQPPQTWDEFLTASQQLTQIDNAGNIIQSGAALGLETNVEHFKEIISLLVLQSGNPIVDKDTLQVLFAEEVPGASLRPAQGALRFFSEFSNPRKASYSWSQAKSLSSEAFLQGTLAMYFGFGSEFQNLRAKNPHLNFDLAPVPQIRGSSADISYTRFLSLGITRSSQNPEAAFLAMRFFVSNSQLRRISQNLLLAPSRRGLLAEKTENPVLEVLNQEAIKARSWLDIDSTRTSEIFANMIRSVYSGRKGTIDATRDAQLQLEALYPR